MSDQDLNTPHIWRVGALCRAIADALEARFNPVTVRGEITGFSRATSGHCYFSLKDETGQIRCAMFRRAATLLDFAPREGDLVEVRGRLGVYEARGDLQLIVESMRQAGQGALFEQFLQRKAKLEAEGLFDAARKRALPVMPRGIGVVTSLGAAALHDVVTALQRRVPHLPVVVAPAAVQGAGAPGALVESLSNLYLLTQEGRRPKADSLSNSAPSGVVIDVILLVRGGGSLEDLWAFNDEQLVRTLARSPVPVVSGVGHETDFTLADFVADLRAPTPTAAAELVAFPQAQWAELLETMQQRLGDAVLRRLDRQSQRLDVAVSRLGRPSGFAMRHRLALQSLAQRLGPAARAGWGQQVQAWQRGQLALSNARGNAMRAQADRLNRVGWQLDGLDPAVVLQRGYAWLTDADGKTVIRSTQAQPGQALRATLADGALDLQVVGRVANKAANKAAN